MLEGPIGVIFVCAVGAIIVLAAGYFSPPGLHSLLTFQHWAVVIGAISPALIALLWAYIGREKSDDYPLLLAFVIMVLMADLFVGLLAGFFLRNPTVWWMRTAIGFVFGALTMVWVLWMK
jgi:hypothetical protein